MEKIKQAIERLKPIRYVYAGIHPAILLLEEALTELEAPEPAAPVQSAGIVEKLRDYFANRTPEQEREDRELWYEIAVMFPEEDFPQPQGAGVWKLVDKDFKEKDHPNLTLRWTTTKGPDGWFQETHWFDSSETAQPHGERWATDKDLEVAWFARDGKQYFEEWLSDYKAAKQSK